MKGITVSNRLSLDSEEELPDAIVIVMEMWNDGNGDYYEIYYDRGSYYIPSYTCRNGDDWGIYVLYYNKTGSYINMNEDIKDMIAKIVYQLSYTFNKPHLHVKVCLQGPAVEGGEFTAIQ